MYKIRNFPDGERFSKEFYDLRAFLKKHADKGANEHFHVGRWDWMMAHSYLETDRLSKLALFYNEEGELSGAALFDTGYHDRWYLVRASDDESLLSAMVSYAENMDGGKTVFRVNGSDSALEEYLSAAGYERGYTESVLEITLEGTLSYPLPEGVGVLSAEDAIDLKEYRRVVYHGFDHEGEPEEPDQETLEAEKYLLRPGYIKVFTERNGEYLSHAGIWYDGGETAYIEPVVTVPQGRGKGLGRAAVYEGIGRARKLGAKRAIVLSDQEFYKRLGMTVSSRVSVWERKG